MSKRLPAEALLDLRRRLETLPPGSTKRRDLIKETATLYGVAEVTLYRALQSQMRPKAIRRSDSGEPRVMPKSTLERYCEIVAAIKVRTSNKQGRHLSTAEALRLLETYGIETPDGLVQVPPEVLKKTTVNRYLKQWGYDRHTLLQPPPAVRFQSASLTSTPIHAAIRR